VARTDCGAPYLLVDLSNICRDESVIGTGLNGDWDAYLKLMSAIRQAGIAFSRPRLIADANLRYLMDAHGKSELRNFEQSGDLEVTPLADERLLEYAFGEGSEYAGALVASLDRFDDFRRLFPQIQGNTDRFIGWRMQSGVLQAFYRDMSTSGHYTISRKEEHGVLKERKYRRDAITSRAESTYFRCDNTGCLVHKMWPDHIRELPRYDVRRDTFVCPACRTELERAGPRPQSVQLIVFLEGAERARILLQRGETVTVGRSDAQNCIGLRRLLDDADSSAVSRRHLEFRLKGSTPEVRDLGSKNGTFLHRSGSSDTTRIGGDEWIRFGRRQIVTLADRISFEVSGRRIAFDGERPQPAKSADLTDSPTRLA
jgi:hypothetical protein